MEFPERIFLEVRQDCPTCGSGRLERSRPRSLVERWMGLLILPYRCVDCDLRFFQFRSEKVARRWRRLELAWRTRPASGARKIAG